MNIAYILNVDSIIVIIHYIDHSVYNINSYMSSNLFYQYTQQEKGFLFISEIFNNVK